MLKSATAANALSGRLTDLSQTVRNARAISAQSTGIIWRNGFALSASSLASRIEFRIEFLGRHLVELLQAASELIGRHLP